MANRETVYLCKVSAAVATPTETGYSEGRVERFTVGPTERRYTYARLAQRSLHPQRQVSQRGGRVVEHSGPAETGGTVLQSSVAPRSIYTHSQIHYPEERVER